MQISKQQLKQIIKEEVQAVLNEKKKKANPWAICTSQVGRKNKKKYEKCVKAIKRKKKLKEAATDYVWGVKGVHRIANKFGGWVPIKRKKSKKRKS